MEESDLTDIKTTYRGRKDYPKKFEILTDPPAKIYYKGKAFDENLKTAAIIGSRNCTEYGRKCAEYFAGELSKKNIAIVSGLAKGTDAYAHKAAIKEKGYTIGIIGSGIDIMYPKENESLYKEMAEYGTILSEFPYNTPPLPQNFPKRNRLIAALSDIVIVIEAEKKSGSMITVSYALNMGKDVFCVPGRINDKMSAGCLNLISLGAYPLLNAKDLFEALRI